MTAASHYIYLDVCTLCRPFDDQTQMRIRLETEAAQLILSYVRSGDLILTISPVHYLEIKAIQQFTERGYLLALIEKLGQDITFDPAKTRSRAETLMTQSFGPADAAHLAFAETAKADFITCDDRLLRHCQHSDTTVWCGTPTAFCVKENLR